MNNAERTITRRVMDEAFYRLLSKSIGITVKPDTDINDPKWIHAVVWSELLNRELFGPREI